MSVPTYRRSESKTEFLKELYELNVRCGQIVMKKPNKYRQNYGDALIKECLEALACAQEANSICVSNNMETFMIERRYMLLHQVIELCNVIPTTARIFLELTKNIDGYKGDCSKAEAYFGEQCMKIIPLIKSIIDSDKKMLLEIQKEK